MSACPQPMSTCCIDTASTPAINTGNVRARVLLVDDSVMLRKLIAKILTTRNIVVTTADNGKDAVKLAEACDRNGAPFDLILMDVVMPELSGTDAAFQLRQRGYQGKIVVMTARDAMFDMAASLCSGADDFLPKPFGPEEVLRVLKDHCGV